MLDTHSHTYMTTLATGVTGKCRISCVFLGGEVWKGWEEDLQ